ncbi:hypothetical protein TWF481_007886 [Arthrobotrys musiformis]|uniref:Uncharacterized protein n=1 Tax=Arthrobotrys musiformis TaxID=47236 RepID=A0AAV9W7G3_9PEZI
MAPCVSSTESAPRYVGTNGAAPDRNQPARDPPRDPTRSSAPGPSTAPDNQSAPNPGTAPDNGRTFNPGPLPNEIMHVGSWTWDNSP